MREEIAEGKIGRRLKELLLKLLPANIARDIRYFFFCSQENLTQLLQDFAAAMWQTYRVAYAIELSKST